jgi:hypothetical protein
MRQSTVSSISARSVPISPAADRILMTYLVLEAVHDQDSPHVHRFACDVELRSANNFDGCPPCVPEPSDHDGFAYGSWVLDAQCAQYVWFFFRFEGSVLMQ